MKVENIKEVKARFNRFVSELPTEGSVIITKNGRPCALLMPMTKDTDLEVVALSQNKRFWKLYDSAVEKVIPQKKSPSILVVGLLGFESFTALLHVFRFPENHDRAFLAFAYMPAEFGCLAVGQPERRNIL